MFNNVQFVYIFYNYMSLISKTENSNNMLHKNVCTMCEVMEQVEVKFSGTATG